MANEQSKTMSSAQAPKRSFHRAYFGNGPRLKAVGIATREKSHFLGGERGRLTSSSNEREGRRVEKKRGRKKPEKEMLRSQRYLMSPQGKHTIAASRRRRGPATGLFACIGREEHTTDDVTASRSPLSPRAVKILS